MGKSWTHVVVPWLREAASLAFPVCIDISIQ